MPVSPLRHCPNRMINFLAHLVDELVEKRATYERQPFYTKRKSERYDTQSSFTRKSRRKSRMFSQATRPWGDHKFNFKNDHQRSYKYNINVNSRQVGFKNDHECSSGALDMSPHGKSTVTFKRREKKKSSLKQSSHRSPANELLM